MKYIITNYKFAICRWVAFLIVFLLSLNIQAQDAIFKNGIQQGVVKVRFEDSMTATLSQMQIKTKGNTLSTGITSFDRAANSIKAMRMERLIPECPNADLEARHRKAGLHLWYVVEFDESIDPKAAAQALKSVSGVKTVECEYFKTLVPSSVVPYQSSPSTYSNQPFNDPYLKDQWHYINTGQLNLPGGNADVNLGEAWKVTAGSSDVIVAIMDQGVDVNHEDLKDNMWVNTKEIPGNGIDDDGNGYIDDIHGFNFVGLSGNISAESHGTHVAGTVAAVNNNGIGVSGVAGGIGNKDGAKVMSLQIIGGATAGHIFKAFVYAADMGAVISQNSWGYQNPGVTEADVMAGIDYFIDYAGGYAGSPMKGGIVIFAAGNDSADDMFWPGIYERCLAVSAVGPEWKIASYSNYGQWIEISAPGGDIDTYGTKAGVLSTLPGNQYGYLQGTSMACPHVSGIAALALASSDTQMTNTQLWQRLLTSVTDIYKYNDPTYAGKLGTGSIDASLVVKNDGKIAPDKITTLSVKGIAQEFATLEWKVPADSDDGLPYSFNIYYSTDTITSVNLSEVKKLELNNTKDAGETITYEVNDLLGTTKYYFAVNSSDRWGNISVLSNVVVGRTNDGPAIDVNTGAVNKDVLLSANVTSSAIATKTFQLLNNSEGVLRWEYFTRNSGYIISPVAYSLPIYPVVVGQPKGVGTKNAEKRVSEVRNTEIASYASFTPTEKRYVDYTSVYIGDTDPLLPTSAAVKFIVDEENGFNLTQVDAKIKYTLETGPIIVEVYNGTLGKDKLIYSQEYQPDNAWNSSHKIALKEHLFFAKGSEFYIVVHVPSGNGYSLGIGVERSAEYSDYCFYSSNYGTSWNILTSVGISQSYAWDIVAVSACENVGKHIVLDPISGDIVGNSNATISLTADGSTLVNGTYKTNVIFKSNDSKNPEYRMPVQFTIMGHKANVVHPNIVEFGSVFITEELILDIVLENTGYGLIDNLTATVNNTQFEIVSQPATIQAKSESTIRIKFKPTTVGNINGKLTVTNGQNSYSISLFGVGAETSEITLTPASGTISGITIGDQVEANFAIKNTGAYPLKYFIPGFDELNISKDWPSDYHSYGYAIRSNKANLTSDASLVYAFNDISTTGVDITTNFITNKFKEVSLGFDFPYYGTIQDKIFITKNGFTSFDNNTNPSNQPTLEGDLRGYISIMGFNNATNLLNGKIYYKAEADRFIIQYSNVGLGVEFFTVQMVLFANGNIRFYYKDIPTTLGSSAESITILIEDIDQTDGILFRDHKSSFLLENGTVLGFDYPGPNIITTVENGSGIVAPNQTVNVKVKMNTESLSEGITNRNINIISNDPNHINSIYQAILNIVAGGIPKYTLSVDNVDFDVVYQGYTYAKEFTIRNIGSKLLTISSFVYDNTKFTLSGNLTIDPGLNEIYKISPNTTSIADLNDVLQINFTDGTSVTVELIASVRTEPVIVADLTPISESLNIGDKSTHAYTIENTGGSDLDVSIIGGQWFRFEETTSTPISKYGYAVKRENSGEPSYNWVNIMETGTKCPYDPENATDKNVFWHKIKLPFNFKYYGLEYDSIRIGGTGIIALGGDPNSLSWPSQIPIDDASGASFICPLWSPGAFDTYSYPNEAGAYYQLYEDKVVISWMYFVNLFGWGQSMQAILFKDGTIKFQYQEVPGMSDGTGSGIVGIQNMDASEYTIISQRTVLPHGEGLAYLIIPDNTHTVAPNDKIEGNIVVDAQNIYGGNFNDNFQIKSNAPTNPELLKPISVSVSGTAVVDAPVEIKFDDLEVVYNPTENEYQYVLRPLVITNTGTAPFRITNGQMEIGGQCLTQMISVSGSSGSTWIPIEDVMTYPQQLILPGASFSTYVRFRPEIAKTYEDVLVLSSTIGDVRIKLKGLGYNPAEIKIDDTPINVSFNTTDESIAKNITFDNVGGGYKLDYNIHVDYKRGLAETKSTESIAKSKVDTVGVIAKTRILDKTSTTPTIKPYADFNRKIQYLDERNLNNGMGNNGSTTTLAATKFVADKTGFNLTDVGSFVTLDKGVVGTIKVEVRVGGSNITNALTIGTGSFDFTYPESVEERQVVVKCNITLDEPVQILPNEEFYVIFTYPMDLTYPQTIQLDGAEVASGRYLWFLGGEWYDLQEYFYSGGLPEGSGFIMYAAEKEFKESGWVKILTSEAGTLQVGESSSTDIKIVGTFAERGDQKANLVFKSNDVNASVVEVPISLHMNEAPAFVDVPTSVITAEKEVRTIDVVIKDKEGHTYELVVSEKPDFATETKNEDGSITYTLTPDYGSAGTYKIVMKATDQYAAANEHTINIHVAKTNQAPKYIGETTELKYNVGVNPVRININDLFSDPDGDDFTFTVTSQDKSIVEVYQSGSENFIVEPKNAGATKLTFVAKDVYSASTTQVLDVVVESCLDPTGVIVQKWNHALIVNNLGGTFVAYQWYKNDVALSGATKQYYVEGAGELDFEATYYVQLTTTDGKTVFTCPFTPVKKEISMKAYPNPVVQGESVKIEAQLPDLDIAPLTIQVISLSGNIIKTMSSQSEETSVPMDCQPGSYLIRVSNANISKTFNVIVR